MVEETVSGRSPRSVLRRGYRAAPVTLLVVVAHLCLPIGVDAAVGIGVSRGELLYSQKGDPDCTKLHMITDDTMLPFNVARLHATVDGAPAGQPLSYQWSIAKNANGILAADLDIGPGGEVPAVSGMCAEFGNACVLTQGKLKFYNEQTVFFVAPTCAVLPDQTAKQFPGGTTKVGLLVTAGRKKLGKAKATLGWGHNGAVKLRVLNTRGEFDDGLGKRNGVNTFAVTALSADVTTAPNPSPPGGVKTFFFDGEGFNSAETDSCNPFPQFNACVELDVLQVGRAFPTVEARFDDGSALCDKLEVQVGACSGDVKLEAIPKPKLATYDPGDPRTNTVDLTVRVRNTSHSQGGLPACNLLLRGANVLSCTEELKTRGLKDTKTTNFDLRHCSKTTSQPCNTNAGCDPQACGSCEFGEICLTTSHCSELFTKDCNNDEDCDNKGPDPAHPACPTCKDHETCIRVLNLPSEVVVPVGGFFDLLTEQVRVRNVFPDIAQITDTWKVDVFLPHVSDDTKLKYRIRGAPR